MEKCNVLLSYNHPCFPGVRKRWNKIFVYDQLMYDNEVSVLQLQRLQADYLDVASALLFEVLVFCQEVRSVISSIDRFG